MDTLRQDLRFALRNLARRPGFAVVAVLTLALGIGANTAIFSVVDAVLLSPLPFAEPERLVIAWASNSELARQVGLPDKLPVSPGDFVEWQKARSLRPMAMMTSGRRALTGSGEPLMIGVVEVSGDFFSTLGTRPLLGRTLVPADDAEGDAHVSGVVLSHGLWQRRFGSDPGVVGSAVVLDGSPVTVVGVMPPAFAFPRGAEMPAGFGFAAEPEAWVPTGLTRKEWANHGSHGFLALGRLAPGVGREAAQAELLAICERLDKESPMPGWRVRLEPLGEALTGDVRPALLILLGAVALVLLIACANVANLLLAQAATRSREVAIRTALGAGRRRLVRQLLTESALLAGAGAALGLLFAGWGLRGLAAFLPADVPLPRDLALDGRVLAFTAAAALATGLLAGLAPALHASRAELGDALREGARGAAGSARGRRTRGVLVAAELAIAVVLVIGAGLLLRSFARLTAVDPGFRSGRALALAVDLPGTRYPRPRRAAFAAAVLERLRQVPGVTAAGAVSRLPMSGQEEVEMLTVEGEPRPAPGKEHLADWRAATPGYFEAMGIPLVRGRTFTAADSERGAQVAVVDEQLARAWWPGQDPIGKRFRTGLFDDSVKDNPWMTVVGVVGNVRNAGLHVEPRPQAYQPHAQGPSADLAFVVRTTGDPAALARQARAVVYAVDRGQPVAWVRTLDDVVAGAVAGRRFQTALLGLFAALALALSVVGIYGLTSYSVSQRTREMGLRMALGARRSSLLRLILTEAGALAAVGVVAGVVLALGLTRLLASLLFGIGTTDPATFGAVVLGLAGVALLSAYVPGLRATRVHPMEALRNE